jgi:hypothetical protein
VAAIVASPGGPAVLAEIYQRITGKHATDALDTPNHERDAQ